jgi:hypothetical protein
MGGMEADPEKYEEQEQLGEEKQNTRTCWRRRRVLVERMEAASQMKTHHDHTERNNPRPETEVDEPVHNSHPLLRAEATVRPVGLFGRKCADKRPKKKLDGIVGHKNRPEKKDDEEAARASAIEREHEEIIRMKIRADEKRDRDGESEEGEAWPGHIAPKAVSKVAFSNDSSREYRHLRINNSKSGGTIEWRDSAE